MMTNPKACFSKHSQWPPESFRLRQSLWCSFLCCSWLNVLGRTSVDYFLRCSRPSLLGCSGLHSFSLNLSRWLRDG
uniref:Uncharacterized protein n=1 Tax=Manihot esculenta TaxID=3983 RepID=A0A2C9UW92_MANES